jgi:homoserine kinase type II
MPDDRNIADIVGQARAAYGVRVIDARPVGYGSGNWNYRLTTEEGDFVLCLIEEQTAHEVHVMAQTLQWLADHGYPSSALRRSVGGALTTVIDGKPALLRRFLPGDVCWALDEDQVRQVGASLAALHRLPCPGFLPTDIYYTQGRFTQALGSGHDPAYEAWVKRSLDRLDVGSYADLPRGLIHADAFPDNILFDGGELVAIIDFELACDYLLAFDLAMAIVGLCLDEGRPCFAKIDSLIAGYESLRPLGRAEIAAIQPLTEYAAIMTSLWRYWRYCCHEPGHAKQHGYRALAEAARQVAGSDFTRRLRASERLGGEPT